MRQGCTDHGIHPDQSLTPAERAVKYILDVLPFYPNLAYYLCPGTQMFEELCNAEAERLGVDVETFKREYALRLTPEDLLAACCSGLCRRRAASARQGLDSGSRRMCPAAGERTRRRCPQPDVCRTAANVKWAWNIRRAWWSRASGRRPWPRTAARGDRRNGTAGADLTSPERRIYGQPRKPLPPGQISRAGRGKAAVETIWRQQWPGRSFPRRRPPRKRKIQRCRRLRCGGTISPGICSAMASVAS